MAFGRRERVVEYTLYTGTALRASCDRSFRPFLRRHCPRASFDEIPEVRACYTPDNCEIIDPIEFAKHGETPKVIGERFFQKAKEMLGVSSTSANV